ncbi:MAG: hypothetical protein Nk1A_6830 [Endomicrobiia bacterium]|nr:MAG: hypothetical protein Nk1A_6830 [Endomicrobiia bacterium]
MPNERMFSSSYQPSPENKSKGHRVANLRKKILAKALGLDDPSSNVLLTIIANIRNEFLKPDNMEMILHILDKLAPKEMTEKPQIEPLQIIFVQLFIVAVVFSS